MCHWSSIPCQALQALETTDELIERFDALYEVLVLSMVRTMALKRQIGIWWFLNFQMAEIRKGAVIVCPLMAAERLLYAVGQSKSLLAVANESCCWVEELVGKENSFG